MKSVKRGRGPSLMGGIMSICIGLFGVVWTVIAVKTGGGFFGLFGIIFIIIAAVQAVYNFRNAAGKNRYSEFDITEDTEETDPLNERFGYKRNNYQASGGKFCPYCGKPVEPDYEYCSSCGRKLPD